MSTRSQQWEDLLIFGRPLPSRIDQPDLPLPDSVYLCTVCGKTNNYFKWVCEGCSDPNGGDGHDD